jgi:hypothetical protein
LIASLLYAEFTVYGLKYVKNYFFNYDNLKYAFPPGDGYHAPSPILPHTVHPPFLFRGKKFDKEKDPGTIRIMTLGGSTTYGFCVETKDTYPFQLEKILNEKGYNVEVINAAVSGYTTMHSLINYMLNLVYLEPDIVYIYHGINDVVIGDNPETFKTDYSHVMHAIGAEWYEHSNIYTILQKRFKFFTKVKYRYLSLKSNVSRLFKFSSKSKEPSRRPNKAYDPVNNILMETIISNLRHITVVAKEHNTKLVYSTFATMYEASEKEKKKLAVQMKNQFGRKPNWFNKGREKGRENRIVLKLEFLNNEIVKLGSELNVPVVDIATIGKKAENFHDEIHQSPQGNRLQAEKTSQILISNKMIHKEANSFEIKK